MMDLTDLARGLDRIPAVSEDEARALCARLDREMRRGGQHHGTSHPGAGRVRLPTSTTIQAALAHNPRS